MLDTVIFTPETEMDKAINLIKNDAAGTSATVSDVEHIVQRNFANDNSINGGGFFVAYFRKPGVKINGLRAVPYKGGTLLSTFCSPDRVKGHYKDVKYHKDAKMNVVAYSTPARLEIFSEIL